MSMLSVLKLFGRPIDSLTIDDLGIVRDAFKLSGEITPAMRMAALKAMTNKGATIVADILNNPELIEDLRRFLEPVSQGITDASTLVQCARCDGFSFVQKVKDGGGCPHCQKPMLLN